MLNRFKSDTGKRSKLLRGSRLSERGNIFFTLFGAVAVVGAIGMGSISLLKGPVSTMVQVNQKTIVETQGELGLKLMMNQTLQSAPDCDSDQVIEAAPWRTGAGPTGGGLIPDDLETTRTTDPWGNELGYCVWDHGDLVDDGGCGGAGQNRLPGLNTTTFPAGDAGSQTFVAIISSGADQVFQTTCRDWASADIDGGADGDLADAGDLPLLSKTSGSDDLIFSYTYDGARSAMGDNWVFQADTDATGDASKSQQGLEMSQDVTFDGILDLDKLGGGLILPDAAGAVCDASTDGQLFRDEGQDPPAVVMCENGTGFVSIGGGSGETPAPTCLDCFCQLGSIGSGDLTELNSYTSGNMGGTRDIAISGNYAFVAARTSNSITALNISDPSNIIEVDSYTSANLGGVHGITISGNYAYVAAKDVDRITVLDISDPSNLTEAGSFTNGNLNEAHDVIVVNSYAYVAPIVSDALTILDVSNPASISEVDSYTSANLDGVTGITKSGNVIYAASFTGDTITALDVSNPASISELDSHTSANLDGARDVDVSGNYAFVIAVGSNAVTVINISNPSSLSEVDSYTSANLNGAYGIEIVGDYAYVTSRNADRLTVLDISDPENVSEVDSYTSANLDGARGIKVIGNNAYVSSENADSLTAIEIDCTLVRPESDAFLDNPGPESDVNYKAYAWGNDDNGQLGNGASVTVDQIAPYVVSAPNNFLQVSSESRDNGCGITTDGKAWCWGLNGNGQLGNGDPSVTQSDVPVEVVGNHHFSSVCAGNAFSCGLKENGEAWCWGGDWAGQLGNGSADSSNQFEPVKVSNINDFVQLDCSFSACGVRSNGEAYCWGEDSDDRLGNGPETAAQHEPTLVQGPTNFVQISTGATISCGVTEDGAAWCWGKNEHGQAGGGYTSVEDVSSPSKVSNISDFIQISAGFEHVCAVRQNGEAYCWGNDYNNGMIGDGVSGAESTPSLVSNIADFVKIDAGNSHTCGLTSEGEIYCWGSDSDGQLGNGGTTGNQNTPSLVVNLSNFTDVRAGNGITVATTKTLQDGDERAPEGPYRIIQSRPSGNTMVSHGLAINLNSTTDKAEAGLAFKVDETSTGGGDSVSASIMGQRIGSGLGDAGGIVMNTWDGATLNKSLMQEDGKLELGYPTGSGLVESYLQIHRHDLGSGGGRWSADGRFDYGLLVTKDTGTINPMYMGIDSLTGAATILTGKELKIQHSTLAGTLTEAAKFDATSSELYGDVDMPINNSTLTIEAYSGASNNYAAYHFLRYGGSVGSPAATSGSWHTLGSLDFGGYDGAALNASGQASILASGKVNGVGDVDGSLGLRTYPDGVPGATNLLKISDNGNVVLGASAPPSPKEFYAEGRGAANDGVKMGNDPTCDDSDDEGTIRYTGSAWEYCDGSDWISFSATQSNSCSNDVSIYSVAGGRLASCAVLSNGQVGCWGNNNSGALGNPQAANPQTTMMIVEGIKHAVDVAVGDTFGCAVLKNGEMWCWGSGSGGKLGYGSTENAFYAVKVAGNDRFIQTSADWDVGCGLTELGEVKCSGFHTHGRLGNGVTTGSSSTPSTVVGISNAIKITSGDRSSCAVLADGTAKCWGDNDNGQLGSGTASGEETTPVAVALTDIVDIEMGGGSPKYFGCALKKNGTVWCWGYNGEGQAGNGTTGADELTPVQVSGISNAVDISSGYYGTCAVINDGTIECWGAGDYGYLGNGGISDSSSPVTVSGITTAVSLMKSQHGRHNCAILQDGSMKCWGRNIQGQLGIGVDDDDNHTTPVDFLNPLSCGYFGFVDVANAARSTQITSNTITLSNMGSGLPVSITGDGSPEFRINGGSWVSSGTVSDGDTLQLRLMSSGSLATEFSATLTAGTYSDEWSVTTTSDTLESFSFVASNDGSSPTITIPGTPTAGDLCIIWNIGGGAGGAADITPAGFTKLMTRNSGFVRSSIFAKKLDGTETTVTGLEGLGGSSSEVWIAATFRPNLPFTSFANGMVPNEAMVSGSNPSVQTITASGETPPIILFGMMGETPSGNNISPRSISPSMNELSNGTKFYSHYRIYNSGDTPANVTYDMDDEGGLNTLVSGYLTFTE